MRYAVPILLLVCMLPATVCAELSDYGNARTEELLFLHTVIYDYLPGWKRTWERVALSSNGTRSTFGSISKSQLLHYEDIVINQDLGRGWWFRGRFNWEGTRHLDTDESSRSVGFQKELLPGIALSAMADFRHEKAKIDAAFGLVFTSPDREQYAWFDFTWDDIAFDERTRSSGKTTRRPLGLRWQVRQSAGQFTLVSDGVVSNGFSRVYGPGGNENSLTRHDQLRNRASATVFWRLDNNARLECGFDTYHYDELQRFADAADNYTYLNEIHHGVLRYLTPWEPLDMVWVELHGIRQFMRSTGTSKEQFVRTELLPGIFVEHRWGTHTIDGGYLGSFFGWDLDDRSNPGASEQRDDYTDKLSMAWTYHFNDNAAFRAALSHVVDIERFGGGNGQLMLLF